MSVILPVTNGESVEIRPSKIIGLGLNYLEHIKKSNFFFLKAAEHVA